MRTALALALALALLALTACSADDPGTVSESQCMEIPIKDLPEDCRQYPGFDELMNTADEARS